MRYAIPLIFGAALVLAVGGCGEKADKPVAPAPAVTPDKPAEPVAKPDKPAPKPDEPVARPAPPKGVAAKVTAFMAAHNAMIAKPNIDEWASSLQDSVFWFGSAPSEALVGRAAVADDLKKVFGPAIEAGGKFAIKSGGKHVGVADDGRGAWVAEELTVTVTIGDQPMVIPYRITSLLGEADGKWTILSQHWSIGLPNEAAMKLAASGGHPPLAKIPGEPPEATKALVEFATKDMKDAKAWLATFTDGEYGFAFGSAPEEKLAGGRLVKQAFGQFIEAYKVTLTYEGLNAGLTPSGTVGWVATNLSFHSVIEGDTVTQPMRALNVYQKKGDSWEMVQAHFSNGIAD